MIYHKTSVAEIAIITVTVFDVQRFQAVVFDQFTGGLVGVAHHVRVLAPADVRVEFLALVELAGAAAFFAHVVRLVEAVFDGFLVAKRRFWTVDDIGGGVVEVFAGLDLGFFWKLML